MAKAIRQKTSSLLDHWTAEELARFARDLDPKARPSGNGWSLRCVAHEDEKPSLSLAVSRSGALLAKCHAGCSQAEVIGALRSRIENVRASDAPEAPPLVASAAASRRSVDAASGPRRLFERGRPIVNTPAVTYLVETRKIPPDVVDTLASSARYVGSLPPPKGVAAEDASGALVLRLDGPDGALRAVQRQWLTAAGEKAPFEASKRFLGSPAGAGCYVGLSSGEPIRGQVLVAEGLETLLSAMAHHNVAQGVAAMTADNLAKLELPPTAVGDPATVLIAHDHGAVGEEAARRLAERLREQGHQVDLLSPPAGRSAKTGKPADWNDVLCGAMISTPTEEKAASPPRGYRRADDGSVEVVDIEASEEPVWRRLCSPIEVLSLVRDGRGHGWGYRLRLRDADGVSHVLTVAATDLVDEGRDVLRLLLDRGLRLENLPHARRRLLGYISGTQTLARKRLVRRFGWGDDACTAFVSPTGALIGDADLALCDELQADVAQARGPAGSLHDWRREVAGLAQGNPLLMLAICASFTGPLLEPMGIEGGGVHLRGESSRGKTSALLAAASVWGGPEFVSTWRATDNGLELIAARANSTVLILDELGQIDAAPAAKVAYMLAQGQAKRRANADVRLRPTATWRLLFLSSGEIGLADKMAEAGRRPKAGEQVRMLDIPATDRRFGLFDELHGSETPGDFVARLRSATAQAHGTAGSAFVQTLLEDLPAATDACRRYMADFCEHAEAALRLGSEVDAQVHRAIQRFGVIAAAGEFASQNGISGWRIGAASEALLVALRLWLDGRGGPGSLEAVEAVEAVREFIARYGSDRFEPIGGEPSRSCGVRNRAGWYHPSKCLYVFLKDVWRQEVCKGRDPIFVARRLRDVGLLEHDPSGLQCRLPRYNNQRPWGYAVREQILTFEGSPFDPDQSDLLDRSTKTAA